MKTGIQWTFARQLEDLDFADDICLLSHRYQDAQAKLSRLAGEAAKTGLQINIQKTETMRTNEKQANPLLLEGKNIKEVDKFTYLGSVVDKHGGTEEDIKSRTNKARFAFNSLRQIWNSSVLSIRNKLRIFNTTIVLIDCYVTDEEGEFLHYYLFKVDVPCYSCQLIKFCLYTRLDLVSEDKEEKPRLADERLAKDDRIEVAYPQAWYTCLMVQESATGSAVQVDFGEPSKRLGSLKYPDGRDIQEVERCRHLRHLIFATGLPIMQEISRNCT
ncbi:hypothetical protein EGW08_019439 [Elysia chlorotica]|uniref:Reverse transcriptase domain-containing protein n=1 Tax=Elysia chlorotica TaxID=188477 RepID=A0A433SU41_ELYCH|nr:hypothetical protein EGW08_019439 [Elysia chlorotica]